MDNFDFANAVKVETPEPVAQPARKLRGKLARCRHATISYAPANLPLIRTTSMNVSPLSGFTTGDANIDSFIVDSGNRNSVDPLLLYSIMHQESTFKRALCRIRAHVG